MYRDSKIPEGFMRGTDLFQRKIDVVDGRPVVTGFQSPDHQFYAFEDGEELVTKKSADGRVEEVMVRVIDEKEDTKDIPVQEWIDLYHNKTLN